MDGGLKKFLFVQNYKKILKYGKSNSRLLYSSGK